MPACNGPGPLPIPLDSCDQLTIDFMSEMQTQVNKVEKEVKRIKRNYGDFHYDIIFSDVTPTRIETEARLVRNDDFIKQLQDIHDKFKILVGQVDIEKLAPMVARLPPSIITLNNAPLEGVTERTAEEYFKGYLKSLKDMLADISTSIEVLQTWSQNQEAKPETQ